MGGHNATINKLPTVPTCTSASITSGSLPADPDRAWCQVYEVQTGDTIKSVAAMFNITEKALIKLNSGEAQIDMLLIMWLLECQTKRLRDFGNES